MMELSQRNAYAAVGDFATELARELAPSVASARTAMRTMERTLHLDSPMRAPLDRAQRELHRLANTLQDTLRLARSGKLTSRRIDLWVPLRNALRAAAPDARARDIWVEPPPFGREPIWINGDQDALEQLFLNLLMNAVQETDSGGRVTATVSLGDDAVVSIADTGRGIPEGALDRVMEPFYTTKADHAGLGLAIAWRTAAAHGGRLSIESALGRGTTVDVALPRADSAQELLLE
jgi:two-component system sporulation sensor kinase A